MNTVAIITIVVVALLTLIIFGLTWIAYTSCLKSYNMEVNQGKHDIEIQKEFKNKRKGGLLGLIGSCTTFLILSALFVTGLTYKVRGENFAINNQVALVIKSNSMADFYDDEIASEYNYNKSLQFSLGDICIFDKIDQTEELVKGDVYGYKHKDMIIVHRLESIEDDKYKFRGDNNRVSDGAISKEQIIYHYTGNKIKGIGSFVLYAQSYFGLYSLICMLGVLASSEVIYYKLESIGKKRYELLG